MEFRLKSTSITKTRYSVTRGCCTFFLDQKSKILSFHVEIGWMEYRKTVPKIIQVKKHFWPPYRLLLLMASFFILSLLVNFLNSIIVYYHEVTLLFFIILIGRCSNQCVNHSHSPKSTKQPRQIHFANTKFQEAYTCTCTEGGNTFISTATSKWRWYAQGVCRGSIKRRRKRNREGNHVLL